MRRRLLVTITTAAALVAAFATSGSTAGERNIQLRLSVERLEPLKGALYEVWVVEGTRKVSAGTFNIRNGKLVDRAGRSARFTSSLSPAEADAIVVTIEPSPDASPKPSAIVVLQGKPRGTRATLRFPVDLRRIAGNFLLATPTDTRTDNETAGVWFLRVGAATEPSLELPALPASGWVWEGWAVTQGKPLTSGRFTSARGADRSSPFSGPKPGPAFPGEDYVRGLPAGVEVPVDLADGASMIVVTLEPDLKRKDPTGRGPFSIKPLVAQVPAGTRDHVSIRLRRDLSAVPSGTARF